MRSSDCNAGLAGAPGARSRPPEDPPHTVIVGIDAFEVAVMNVDAAEPLGLAARSSLGLFNRGEQVAHGKRRAVRCAVDNHLPETRHANLWLCQDDLSQFGLGERAPIISLEDRCMEVHRNDRSSGRRRTVVEALDDLVAGLRQPDFESPP